MANLIVTCAEHEFCIGLLIQYAFDDLSLIYREWPDFQVLLANEHFYWTLVRKIVFQQVLALTALEQTTEVGASQHDSRG